MSAIALKSMPLPVLLSLVLLSLLPVSCGEVDTGKPHKLLELGWEYYRAGEYAPALKTFQRAERLAKKDPELGLKIQYALATTWNLRRPGHDPVKARAFYQGILDRAPRHDLSAWSLLALARMQHVIPSDQKPDYPAMRIAYQRVIDGFPGHAAADEAFLYQQTTLLAMLKTAEAAAALTNVLAYMERYPQTRQRSPLFQLLANCHQILGNPEARLAAEIEALKTRELDPTNPRANFSWPVWAIANLAEFEVGDFKTAREYYERFLREYPDDNKTYGAQVALARLSATEARVRAGK